MKILFVKHFYFRKNIVCVIRSSFSYWKILIKKKKDKNIQPAKYTTKEELLIESWHYSSFPIRSPMTSICNLDQRELKPKRGSCSQTQSIHEHARIRWHAHVLTKPLDTREPTGPVAYEPTNRAECSQSFRGPSGTNVAAGAFFHPSNFTFAHGEYVLRMRACTDKQRSRVGSR